MNYGIKTLPATTGIIAVTFWGHWYVWGGLVLLVLLIALVIRWLWRRGKGPQV